MDPDDTTTLPEQEHATPNGEVGEELNEPEELDGDVVVPGALTEPDLDVEEVPPTEPSSDDRAGDPDDDAPGHVEPEHVEPEHDGDIEETVQAEEGLDTAETEESVGEAEEDGSGQDGEPRPKRKRRRRGGRGRRGRGRSRGGAAEPDDPPVTETDDGQTDEDTDEGASTRLRSRRKGRRGRAGGKRSDRTARVSEETRWAMEPTLPRTMLVTVGEQRTQVAILEDRDLVEHFVTPRGDTSYVGNIYVGRVQNVLPGMEAAFVDIGKGRNGVLYAGEVNYDEADLEGSLPRIEQTLKSGQTVLVQVTKDPMGTKGARLTQQLSLAGRYCVLAPGSKVLGISRKLPDTERDRLRTALADIDHGDEGLIVRTAAEGATKEQLEGDIRRLRRIWSSVSERAQEADPLSAVYEEPPLVMRVIRDIFGPEHVRLVSDSPDLAGQIREYLGDYSPELAERVELHERDEALFDSYEVTTQIRRALEKKVWLRSGGYLIIEKTEAMWVIDVNTGKFVSGANLEETVLRNNLEAADEIARQLRLRDMGGIIVIDFVDMMLPVNRDEVLKRFKRALARDKTKSRVMDISKLGLVQMTRKNVSRGINDSFTTTCDCCEGRGAQIVDRILA